MKSPQPIKERTILICNPKITCEEYTTKQLHFSIEETASISPQSTRRSRTFKPYNNRQAFAIFDVEELIPANHVARVVDEMIETIPDEQLFAYYTGGGRSPFHPKMMLKVILFAYSQKVYSCRKIETLI